MSDSEPTGVVNPALRAAYKRWAAKVMYVVPTKPTRHHHKWATSVMFIKYLQRNVALGTQHCLVPFCKKTRIDNLDDMIATIREIEYEIILRQALSD